MSSGNRKNHRAPTNRKPQPPHSERVHWSILVLIVPVAVCLIFILWPDKRKGPSSTAPARPVVFAPSAALENGDFEAAAPAPWHALEDNIQWGKFSLGSEKLPDGRTNQFAKVSAQAASPPVALKVFGAVQELKIVSGLPEKLEFRCRIAQEKKLCTKQYAQAVAIFTPNAATTGSANVQLRHILHGLTTAPYEMANAKFVINPPFTQEGEWRRYALPLRETFAAQYPGYDFSKGTLRLLLEARYDDLPNTAAPGEVALEMHYDDVQARLP